MSVEPVVSSRECEGNLWYVVETKRHRERLVRCKLEEVGIPSYLPRILEWPPPRVGSPIAPMFPGYVFARPLPEALPRVCWTPGVKALVHFGDTLATIEAAAIDLLRGREGPDGLVQCGTPIAEGSTVRIVRGPFRGLTAVVEERLPARERVRVLMDFLQRSTPVEIPERWLGRA